MDPLKDNSAVKTPFDNAVFANSIADSVSGQVSFPLEFSRSLCVFKPVI